MVVTFLVYPSGAKLVATAAFLYLPLHFMKQRDEDYRDLGVTLRSWRVDLKWYLILFLPLIPLYALGFWGYAELIALLPRDLGHHLFPYPTPIHFHPALPDRLLERVVDNLLVVALPEEFFYRGYLDARLREALPSGRSVFGVQGRPCVLPRRGAVRARPPRGVPGLAARGVLPRAALRVDPREDRHRARRDAAARELQPARAVPARVARRAPRSAAPAPRGPRTTASA